MTERVVKCTICGYRFRANPEKQYREGKVTHVREIEETSQPPLTKNKRTVDLTCPNCKNDFEVEVEA